MTKTDFKPRTGARGSGGHKPPPDAEKRAGGPAGGQNNEETLMDTTAPSRFVTIDQFCHMLGLKDRTWYYRHRNDPGMPQPIPVGDGHRKRLDRIEIDRYVEGLIEKRDAQKEKGGP